MAEIPIRTATETCWKKCPEFDVEIDDAYVDSNVFFRDIRCEHVDRCLIIIEPLLKESNDE